MARGVVGVVNLSALPNIWTGPQPRYNPLAVTRRAWLIERWWWTEAHREVQRVLDLALMQKHVEQPALAQIGDAALNALIRTGAWSAQQQVESAKRVGRSVRVPALRTVRMDAYPEPGNVDWTRFPGETWEDFKARVFTPLHDRVFGIAHDFVSRYVETRLPPIKDASVELQTRVQTIIRDANTLATPEKEVAAQLQAAGEWPMARVRTQIRTETSAMYNGGRHCYMQGDSAVIGYSYAVTLDDRTTDICRALAGKSVRREDLRAISPFHFSCRTIMVPLFSFDKGFAWDDQVPIPGEGFYQAAQYKGFGQRDLVAELR